MLPLCCAGLGWAGPCLRARGVFWANMTVGETVLRSAPLTLESPLSVYQDANDFEAQTVPQLQEQQLTAARAAAVHRGGGGRGGAMRGHSRRALHPCRPSSSRYSPQR